MKSRTKIILRSGKDQSPKRFHPWIFSGAIKKMLGEPSEGDLVEVFSNKNEFLGLGHYSPGSIAVRIISFTPEKDVAGILSDRIHNAVKYRQKAGFFSNPGTNVFRLIHAEGDGLPGLIADYYNGAVVMQFHSVGMYQHLDQIVAAVNHGLGDKLKLLYNKSKSTLPFPFSQTVEDDYLIRGGLSKEVLEYGNKFLIDWEGGQKTGFFIDQRESRRKLGELSGNRSVLNLFGYTGGFSVYALQGGAGKAVTIDSSSRAIELARNNVEINFGESANHVAHESDVFDYLAEITELFDIVISDPPAFAKHQKVLNNALKGYRRLNEKVLEKVKPGGILFTFSCSQVVSRENFRKVILSAGASAGRKIRIMHQLTQPTDHPVNLYHPESEYLKGLILYVE
jgi:23S rRNA (cytosine1962-C5)-methyltransferase